MLAREHFLGTAAVPAALHSIIIANSSDMRAMAFHAPSINLTSKYLQRRKTIRLIPPNGRKELLRLWTRTRQP